MSATVRNATSPKRVRFQIQARRVERADESAWFDMEEIRPMSRKASDQAVVDLNKGVPAFAWGGLKRHSCLYRYWHESKHCGEYVYHHLSYDYYNCLSWYENINVYHRYNEY